MNYCESLAYIHTQCWKGSRPGLLRITELLARMGNPERALKYVHIAGTNGKGSFSAMLASVLQKAGYRVGLFVSPYLETFNERIQIDGRPISDDDLAEITTHVRTFADAMAFGPTEFELVTAIGFAYFARKGVDVVVLECGMGGRLDSTNVIEAPLLSVVTGISLDHTEYLGDTIEAIAFEKAGILKPGCPALYGGQSDAAEAVIRGRAEQLGCAYARTDRDAIVLSACTENGSVFDYKSYAGVRLSLLGLYQPQNAANVIEAVGLLRRNGLSIPDEALYDGLAAAVWKGRFEKLAEHPLVFFDGGHNIEGVAAAMQTVRHFFGGKRIDLLTGVMADKRYEKMAAQMAPFARKVFTVSPDNPRALDAHAYADVFCTLGVSAQGFAAYDEAVAAAVSDAKANDVPLLALGSLYAYAPFVTALRTALGR